MPFNSDLHAGVGYIDKPYKSLLDKLCEAHKRGIKAELEHLIQSAAKSEKLVDKVLTSKWPACYTVCQVSDSPNDTHGCGNHLTTP